MKKEISLELLADYYEYTMANGYHELGMGDEIVYFDVFYRNVPDGGGFAICGGLASIVEYVQSLHFDEEDIEFLRGKQIFSESFLASLRDFRFTGDIWAMPEGTVIFPGEPIITVRARTVEAQVIETYLLVCFNHQSLIATKANRIVRAADGHAVLEFGARRAQGASAAYLGARAAYIAGVAATSCTLSDQLFGIPSSGTMAHSWVQMFDSELDAFVKYCEIYPTNASLLVDTYDVLRSGVPNAIKAFDRVLRPLGITNCSIRLDSGDIAYLSRKARQMLDAAGWSSCRIAASNSLDETIIRDLLQQDGKIDFFGVGERLITAKSDPVFGGVYKLCAVEKNGVIIPKIKISENVQKITTPHFKKVYRLFDKANDKAIADLICIHDEHIDDTKPLTIFDPDYTWKSKTLTNFYAVKLQTRIFKHGELVYEVPTIEASRAYCQKQLDGMWDEVKRFENPHEYYVDLSQALWDEKQRLLHEHRRG